MLQVNATCGKCYGKVCRIEDISYGYIATCMLCGYNTHLDKKGNVVEPLSFIDDVSQEGYIHNINEKSRFACTFFPVYALLNKRLPSGSPTRMWSGELPERYKVAVYHEASGGGKRRIWSVELYPDIPDMTVGDDKSIRSLVRQSLFDYSDFTFVNNNDWLIDKWGTFIVDMAL